jgi:BlaI family transcriptional regulator, penicillinase repressor
MPRKSHPELPRPTDAELAILRVLWARENSTGSVRDILEDVNALRPEPLAYTTVLRFLQIMMEKGLVQREDGERGHIYRPSAPAERTKKQLVGDLLHRAFGGSAHEMVLQALGSGKVSAQEVREIRDLLDQIDRRKQR